MLRFELGGCTDALVVGLPADGLGLLTASRMRRIYSCKNNQVIMRLHVGYLGTWGGAGADIKHYFSVKIISNFNDYLNTQHVQ